MTGVQTCALPIFVIAATQALDGLRSGQVLDWSVRDRVVAALAAALGAP